MKISKRIKGAGIIIVSLALIIFIAILISNSAKICSPGEKRCSLNNSSESCTDDGKGWIGIDSCDYGCLNGLCKEKDRICNPGTQVCVGTDLKQCTTIGDSYYNSKQCGAVEGGICKDFDCVYPVSCEIGKFKCDGNIVKKCERGALVNLWVNYKYCLGQCVNNDCAPSETPTQIYSLEFDTLRKSAGIPDKYLEENWYYDYSNIYQNPKAQALKESLRGLSVTDAVRKIIKFTNENVEYNLSVLTIPYCHDNSASMILNKGLGVCSTMSRVNIALLRGIGIPARLSVGCAISLDRCQSLSIANTQQGFPLPINKIIQDDRLVFGGGAHAWVEVWLPDYGWTIVESVYGLLYPTSCVAYDEYANEDTFSNQIDSCSMSQEIGFQCYYWKGY